MVEPSKPRRRWFRFSLRTLLIVMALLPIPLAFVAHEWTIIRKREEVKSLIWKLGGTPVPRFLKDRYGWKTGSGVRSLTPREKFRDRLGDTPLVFIMNLQHATAEERQRIALTFPEAAQLPDYTPIALLGLTPEDESSIASPPPGPPPPP